jgi:hypothetical protein
LGLPTNAAGSAKDGMEALINALIKKHGSEGGDKK